MLGRRVSAIAALAVPVLVVAGLASGSLSGRAASDALLARNFGSALADSDTAWSSLPPNIWLSALGNPGSARVLAPGDTITIATKSGRPDVIEITELSPVDGDRIGAPGVHFQLVTGRSRTEAPGHIVRFMFATERAPAPQPVPADRVL